MEIPICVIDAKTLVDHVQVLKSWIYCGQLRVVVPSCTTEQVEQLCQQSAALKPTTQDPPPPRSRSSGKPPRKEYPAFDINPRVAQEYLGRLKTRKEQEADSEQQIFFREKENHQAVHFQQPNEQYTPWKDLEVEEEKPQTVEGPPTSWAEALRRKQNSSNETMEKLSSKAPAKPKLVARAAGSEVSPWKVKKDAPKISAKDVPGILRPLMSSALWYLHESIDRNDPNQLFFLSDQTEMQVVAQKLNITVRSFDEVRSTIASKTPKAGLDSFGDLERDFGVQQRNVTPPTQDAKEMNGEHGLPDYFNGDVLKDDDIMNKSMSSEGTANTAATSTVLEPSLEKQIPEHEQKLPTNGDIDEDKARERGTTAEKAAVMVAKNIFENPTKSVESIKDLVDGIIQQDSQEHLNGSLTGIKADGVEGQMNLASQAALESSVTRSPPNVPLSQSQSSESVQRLQEFQTGDDKSPTKDTFISSLSITESTQEPEDSDEEVVVFVPQPKRLSAQQKPAQQSPRPSTPKEQSQQRPPGLSPQMSLARPQSKGKAARHSPKPSVVGHAHPQTVNAPTVIDPDAFGRDSRVNLNPSPRLQHHPNGHSNHRHRGNMHNAQGGHIPRNSSRQLARTSPPRNSPHENSRRLNASTGPAPKDGPNHRSRASRTSVRSVPPALEPEVVTRTDVKSKATVTATTSSKSHFSGPQAAEFTEFVPQAALPGWTSPRSSVVHESADFVPRSVSANTGMQSGAPETRNYEPSEFVPRPSKPVREFKPRPKAFQPAEFVPRDFAPKTTVSRTQSKQYLPEPESIEPRPSLNDVDYVLKSGSTRASARGRGRLWVPS